MRLSENQIVDFLYKVDKSFPVPLSEKQDLHEFAIKLHEKATICAEVKDNVVLSAVAGYTENVVEKMAYISIVATLPEERGKGYAPKLIHEFIEICVQKQLDGVHLYAIPSNTRAMSMYEHLGFKKKVFPNEQRPNDAHFVYYIRK